MSGNPGYGPNGELLEAVGSVTWQVIAPPEPKTEGDDSWLVFPLGLVTLPFISQSDDDSWAYKYLGGV